MRADDDDEQIIEPEDIKWPETPGPVAGFKSPPTASRFQPGKSGNPKGRPKKSKETKADIIKKVLLEQHQVTVDGERVSRTTIALVFLALQKKAMDGHSQAAAEFEKLNDRYGPQEPQGKGGVLVVPGRLTPEAWEAIFSPKDPINPGDWK